MNRCHGLLGPQNGSDVPSALGLVVKYFCSRAKILSAIFSPDLLKVSSTDKSNNILIILIFAMYSSDRFSGEICPQIITFQERMDEAKLGLNWDQFRTSVQRP